MKEPVKVEMNGKSTLIGWSSMKYPSSSREVNRIFKMLRLNPRNLLMEGDVFFFEYRMSKSGIEEWVLLTEMCYLSLDSEELMKAYECIPNQGQTTFDELVELIFHSYYWQG